MSTTTEASQVSLFNSVFAPVIELATQREDAAKAEALQKEQAAKAARQARVAEERAAQAAEEVRATEERAAEAARAQAAKQLANLNRNVESFQFGFLCAVSNSTWFKGLKVAAMKEAARYSEALASTEAELPQLDPSMAAVINDKFAYGIAKNGNKIPEGYFVGHRQDWFPALLQKKQSLGQSAKIVIMPASAAPRAKAPVSTPAVTKEVPLPSAVTLKSKRNKRA